VIRMRLSIAAALLWSVGAAGAEPHVAVGEVALGEARWTAGFWKSRFDTCRTATVPALWRIMKGTEHGQFLVNFRVAVGEVEGRHRGAAFNDGDFYKVGSRPPRAVYAGHGATPSCCRRSTRAVRAVRAAPAARRLPAHAHPGPPASGG